MKNCQFLLFLVLIYINGDGTFVCGLCQPPVKEGFPYTMDCSYPLSRALQFCWEVTPDPLGSSSRFYTCDLHQKQRCYQSPKHKVNVTVTSNSKYFKSSLKIPNITTQNRDAKFQCVVWDPSLNKRVTLKTCKIKSYHAPESPKCQSVQRDKGGVSQKCHTSRVYPDILCSLYRAVDGELEKVPTEMTYSKNLSSPFQKAVYYSASCLFTYPADTTDKDYFKIKMFASVDGNAIPGSEKIISINTPTIRRKIPLTTVRNVEILPANKSKDPTQLATTMTPQRNGTQGRQVWDIIGESFMIAPGIVIGSVISLIVICLFIWCCNKTSQRLKQPKSVVDHNGTKANVSHC